MAFTLNYTGNRITDAIAGALSTSLAAYNAAASGSLVPITDAEYANLAATLSGANKTGLNDANITSPSIIGAANWNGNWNIQANSFGAGQGTLTTAGYVVAARLAIVIFNSGTATQTGLNWQIGYSTQVGTPTSSGIALSSKNTINGTFYNNRYAYFVVKSPSIIVPANSGLRVFNGPTNMSIAYGGTAPTAVAYVTGATDVTTAGSLVGAWTWNLGIQFLQTPNKSW